MNTSDAIEAWVWTSEWLAEHAPKSHEALRPGATEEQIEWAERELEAIGTEAQVGAIHTVSLLGPAGDNDLWIEAGDGDGNPGTPKTAQRLGQSVHFT
ncbi:hypothetical protein ACFWFB_32930, partial [Streptomyces albidoflavus]